MNTNTERSAPRSSWGRRLRKGLRIFGSIVLLLLIVGAAGGYWFVRRPWPQVAGRIKAPGLEQTVEVLRDARGIPQIYAATDHDLFFAQGYVHAQDRFWQMEFNRRLGSGRLSEAVGGGTLRLDRFMRTMGLRQAAQRDWEQLDSDTHAILEAYAAGVNAYIAQHRDRLPLEFTILGVTPDTWTPIDSLVWGKVMSLNLGFNYLWELLRAQIIARPELGAEAARDIMTPYTDPEALQIPPEVNNYAWLRDKIFDEPAELTALLGGANPNVGSNSWVVSGDRTASGKPLLANDTHLFLYTPSVWYENGLYSPSFKTVGFSFPGVPLVIIGQNERIAWGVTNLPADVQDLYLERLNDAANPTQYEYQGAWVDLQTRTETIRIKGMPDETLTVRTTRHGPLINDLFKATRGGEPLALRWTTLDGGTLLQAIAKVDQATDWQSFRDGVRLWSSPNQNFVYADVDGNIGYQMLGTLPIRAQGHTGEVPMPGWTGEYEWQGLIPFDELPSKFNPPEGFAATANSKSAPDSYRYRISSEWAAPYRIQRISELLAAKPKLSVEDMQAIQGETYSIPAATLQPFLLRAQPGTELQTKALEQVKAWDLRFETDRIGASVYQAWSWFLVQNILKDEMSQEMMDQYNGFSLVYTPNLVHWMEQGASKWFDDRTTPAVETRDDMIQRSFVEAVDWLQSAYGADPLKWQWGRLHTMTFVHQPLGESGIAPAEWIFNSPAIPARGDDHTVNAAWFSTDERFKMIGGTSERFIVDLSDLTKSLAINSTGQTGHAFHPNRFDTLEDWQNLRYRPMIFSTRPNPALTPNVLRLEP